MKGTTNLLTLFALGLALSGPAAAQQRGHLRVDPIADTVLGMANDMVAVGELGDAPAQGEGSAAPQDEEGAAPALEVQDNGTNPASMGFKFMPYTRHTELENGVSSSDVLTLFAMIPIPLTPFTAITVEWPVQKTFDASSVVLDFIEGTLDPEDGIPCAPPTCGSDRPLSDLPLEPFAAGFDQNGYGDFSLRLIQGLKLFGKPGEGMTTALIGGFQLITPTASHPVLGEERWEFAPLFAHVHNFSARSFLALMHLYFFDFADKSGISDLHKDSDVGFYLGRYFYQYAWPKSGYYLLPELQITYDNESDNGWSAFLMPEVGKSFQAGSMGITAYIKPGWAIFSPDPSERRVGVEMGIRLIP
jgi:hypothetical protein